MRGGGSKERLLPQPRQQRPRARSSSGQVLRHRGFQRQPRTGLTLQSPLGMGPWCHPLRVVSPAWEAAWFGVFVGFGAGRGPGVLLCEEGSVGDALYEAGGKVPAWQRRCLVRSPRSAPGDVTPDWGHGDPGALPVLAAPPRAPRRGGRTLLPSSRRGLGAKILTQHR